jgi:hypothetical protein
MFRYEWNFFIIFNQKRNHRRWKFFSQFFYCSKSAAISFRLQIFSWFVPAFAQMFARSQPVRDSNTSTFDKKLTQKLLLCHFLDFFAKQVKEINFFLVLFLFSFWYFPQTKNFQNLSRCWVQFVVFFMVPSHNKLWRREILKWNEISSRQFFKPENEYLANFFSFQNSLQQFTKFLWVWKTPTSRF